MNQGGESVEELKQSIDGYIERISEGHRMHRKIRFLLDVRGLLIINKIQGDYVEFGVYRGEMMYAAARILSPHIRKYIGLDTFTGLPEPDRGDREAFVFESQGFMEAPQEVAQAMMTGFQARLIRGDFRDPQVGEELAAEVSRISIAALDCNWPSSVRAAMRMCSRYLQCGSIVYLDDYFVGTRQANFNDRILGEATERSGSIFREFMTYPPCGRAYIVETR